jgi:hypothetical protein
MVTLPSFRDEHMRCVHDKRPDKSGASINFLLTKALGLRGMFVFELNILMR